MSQYDIYQYDKPGSRVAWLVDVQSDLLDTLQTRVVIPLYPVESGQKLIRGLNPTVELAGGDFFLSTAEVAAVHVRELRQPMGSLHHMRDEIIAAVDLLFTGI
ncbi:MAG: CcdB family protein [Magnetococcales bacterium]|nr:CcdB family protein [Magnetococcales bacterium]